MTLPTEKFPSMQKDETPEERKLVVRRLLEQAKKYRKKFPPGFKFDRYEANQRK